MVRINLQRFLKIVFIVVVIGVIFGALKINMSTETWGLLPKSQIDDETIEEAIDRLVVAHEADPDSHLGAGESLQSHRASEIIDHAVHSIVPDKMRFQIFNSSPVDDGFFKDVSVGNYIYGGLLNTDFAIQSLNDENLCILRASLGGLVSDWSVDEIYFEIVARASSSGGMSHKWKVGFGVEDIVLYQGTEESWPGIGFYFDGNLNKIYAFYINNANNVVAYEVASFSTPQFFKLRFELVLGVIKYYVNDVLMWTVSNPTFASWTIDTSSLFLGTDYRYDSEPGNPTFSVKYISFSQPNPF